jgi:hypothetical protein
MEQATRLDHDHASRTIGQPEEIWRFGLLGHMPVSAGIYVRSIGKSAPLAPHNYATTALAERTHVTLILRTMNKHAQLMGWGDHWGEDDYVVLDQGRSVGRIYKEIQADPRWCWSI